MIKPILFPLTLLLLTSSTPSFPPKRIDIGGSLGYFSNFTLSPFTWKKPYTMQIKYTLWSNGAHRLTIGWDSETSTYEKDGTYYQYFPLNNQTVSGVGGQEFVFDITVPYKYVCHENKLSFIDYDILGGISSTQEIDLVEKLDLTNRNLGEHGTLYGNTYIDVSNFGKFVKRQPAVDIINYKESIKSDARGIVPLDSIKLDFYNNNGHTSLTEEDDNLTLVISGDNFMDFDPLIGHGGTLSQDEKSIEVPLKLTKDDDGYCWPILDETVFGYDMGKGAEVYSETLPLPKSSDKYPVYHCRIENGSTNLGSYFYEFDLEKGADFFGSCRNSNWCVEVS